MTSGATTAKRPMAWMPQSEAVIPLLPHSQFGMPCLELAIVHFKESCKFPHL